MATLSKSQVDRLGEHLKRGSPSDDDLRLLDEYRRSFGDAFDAVTEQLQQTLQLQPTGRPAKSIPSIIQKLLRESIRLSQIQDIADCRIVVKDILAQNRTVESIRAQFPTISVMDRREKPSHGYRAVHAIPRIQDKPVEIQVRTELQHLWAELSERCSDVYDPGLKYGIGDELALQLLNSSSVAVRTIELLEKDIPILEETITKILGSESKKGDLPTDINSFKLKLIDAMDKYVRAKEATLKMFSDSIVELEKQKASKK